MGEDQDYGSNGPNRYTRKLLAWRLSNRLEAYSCVEALNEAVHKVGPPEIMDTDQGSQFTSFAWTDRMKRIGTRIFVDSKGRRLDNIFIERLWRSLKHECVHVHAWETGVAGKGRHRALDQLLQPPAATHAHDGHPPPWSTSTQPQPISRCRP